MLCYVQIFTTTECLYTMQEVGDIDFNILSSAYHIDEAHLLWWCDGMIFHMELRISVPYYACETLQYVSELHKCPEYNFDFGGCLTVEIFNEIVTKRPHALLCLWWNTIPFCNSTGFYAEVLYNFLTLQPVDYEPPFFRCCTEEEAHHPWTKSPLKMEVGNVNSKHFVLALKVREGSCSELTFKFIFLVFDSGFLFKFIGKECSWSLRGWEWGYSRWRHELWSWFHTEGWVFWFWQWGKWGCCLLDKTTSI